MTSPVCYYIILLVFRYFQRHVLRVIVFLFVLRRPSPSISELDAAIHSFCEEHHWDQISDKFGKHQYTTDRQIALRCFESLYLITVLKHAFGFPGSFRGINFAPGLNTGGFSAVDWPLGYLLTQNAAREEVAAALEELNERTE